MRKSPWRLDDDYEATYVHKMFNDRKTICTNISVLRKEKGKRNTLPKKIVPAVIQRIIGRP